MAQEKNKINEELVKQIISQGVPVKGSNKKDVEQTPSFSDEVKENPGVPETSEKPIKESIRRRKTSNESYTDTFLKSVNISGRQLIYVNGDTHERLTKIVTVIGNRKVTLSSLLENIIQKHFEEYGEEINHLYEQAFKKPF